MEGIPDKAVPMEITEIFAVQTSDFCKSSSRSSRLKNGNGDISRVLQILPKIFQISSSVVHVLIHLLKLCERDGATPWKTFMK